MALILPELKEKLKNTKKKPNTLRQEWYAVENARTEEEKKSLRDVLFNSTIVFRALASILTRSFDKLDAKQIKYGEPEWESRLLYAEGYKQALKDVYNLIPMTKE
jgi:hypothetical protein